MPWGMRVRTACAGVALLALVGVTGAAPAVGARVPSERVTSAGQPESWHDFNADGFADLAIGMNGRDVSGQQSAGAVLVLYGSSRGLSSAGSQFWHQNVLGIANEAEGNDNFGTAVAAGDFNGDDIGDLAIGVPDEAHTGFTQAGLVHVLFGSSPGGLTANGSLVLKAGGVGDQTGKRFGAALVAADRLDEVPNVTIHNGADGIADLVVGIPGTGNGPGTFRLLRGDADEPLTGAFITPGCPEVVLPGRCGLVLAAGKLDGDDIDDIVIGSPDAPVGTASGAGMVTIDRTSGGTTRFSFSEGDLQGRADVAGAGFGSAFAIGDTGSSAAKELFIGAPGHPVPLSPGPGNIAGAGRVFGLIGSASGPTNVAGTIDADDADIPGDPGTIEAFGSSLALADLGRTSGLDLVIGVPGDTVNGRVRAGSIVVLYHDDTSVELHQDSTDILGTAAADERFGALLAIGDFGRSATMDLAVGIPRDVIGPVGVVGAVSSLYGSATGLTANDQWWHLDQAGVPGVAREFDRFGSALD